MGLFSGFSRGNAGLSAGKMVSIARSLYSAKGLRIATSTHFVKDEHNKIVTRGEAYIKDLTAQNFAGFLQIIDGTAMFGMDMQGKASAVFQVANEIAQGNMDRIETDISLTGMIFEMRQKFMSARSAVAFETLALYSKGAPQVNCGTLQLLENTLEHLDEVAFLSLLYFWPITSYDAKVNRIVSQQMSDGHGRVRYRPGLFDSFSATFALNDLREMTIAKAKKLPQSRHIDEDLEFLVEQRVTSLMFQTLDEEEAHVAQVALLQSKERFPIYLQD